MPKPLISFAVPCYNVEEYVTHCVESIVAGCAEYLDRIEILLVDDGSVKDNTPALVDELAAQYPQIVTAIHQENGGHGQAVNTGLAEATGEYFKVVDADDWLDEQACKHIMKKLAEFAVHEAPIDLVISNYVYEKVFENKHTSIRYTRVLPQDRQFTWDEIGKFAPSHNILMHSVIYRTQLLKDMGLVLPKHTFYVDNIFVYVPLPQVKTLYYMNVDLYRYFIGREGQSVNEQVMIGRIEQQLKITRIMIDAYDLTTDVPERKLRNYMENYLLIMLVICSVFLLLSDREDAEEQRAAIWQYLYDRSPAMYNLLRKRFLGRAVNLKGTVGEAVIKGAYRIARKVFKFN